MNRKCSTSLAVGLMVLLGAALPATAKGPASTCGSNVTSIIADKDSFGNAFQIQSDGQGSYKTNNSAVTSQIVKSSCYWTLNMLKSTSRTVTLTFAYPASNGATAPFVGPQKVAPNIESHCVNNPLNTIDFGQMSSAGQTLQCPMHAVFDYNGQEYGLTMDPGTYAGSSYVQVECTGAVSGQCNAWTVSPIPGAAIDPYTNQPAAITQLYLIPSTKGTSLVPLGLYYVSFGFTITNP